MVCEGWEGLTVDGKFPLLEWLRGATDCVFLTVRQGTLEANIKLIAAAGTEADEYLAKWEVAKGLSHPFLVRIMETGRSTLNGSDVVYVVTEKAESFLSGIIPRKALDQNKAKEILDAIVDALSFLHNKGLVHGSVKPSNVIQIGEQWKLASDDMVGAGVELTRDLDTYDAPEVGERSPMPTADLWSVGIIAIEAFAQKTPLWDRTAKGDLGVPDWMPEPFRELARGCLRWEPGERISIAEAKTLLGRHVPSLAAEPGLGWTDAPEMKKTLVTAAPETAPAIVQKSPEKVRPARAYTFTEEEPGELTPRSRMFSNLEEEEEPRSVGWLIFFGVVALVVVAAVLAVRGYWSEFWRPAQTQNAPQASQPSPQAPTPQTEPGQSAPVAPGQTAPQSQSQVAPGENRGATPGGATSQKQGAAPSESRQSSATQNPPLTSQSTAQTQTPAIPSTSAPTNPPQAEKPLETEPDRKNKAEAQAHRIMNAKGGVEKRVLPSVAPGASRSMRRPLEVELRVRVNERGAVSNARYVTQGPGNYFARIAREAAESWKFKAPVSDGRPRESEWILLFRFERRNVEATATEVR